MTEKEGIKRINSLVTEYAIQKIVARRRTNIHLNVLTTTIMIMHKKQTEEISRQIYDLRNSTNGMQLISILDKYSDLLIKDFDEIDYEEFRGVEFSDITPERVPLSYIFPITLKVYMAISNSPNITDTIDSNHLALFGEEAKYPIIFENQAIILREYKNLAYDLEITTAIDLCNFYTYLLWNGYFSPNKEHSYQVRDRITSFPTLEVFQGKGVCLNYAELLKEFLKKCNKDAKHVSCLVNKNIKHDEKYKNLLECKVDITKGEKLKEDIIFLVGTPLIKLIGNHAITLVGDGDKTFYYDPTNLFVLNPEQGDKARIINGTGEFDIKLDFTLNAHEASKIEKIEDYITDIIIKNSSCEAFTNPEVYETMTNVFNKLKGNSSKLDRVYNGIRPKILKINEEIEKHGINS